MPTAPTLPKFVVSNSPSDANFVPSLAPALRALKSALVVSDIDSKLATCRQLVNSVDVNTLLPGIQQWSSTAPFIAGQLCIFNSLLYIARTDSQNVQPDSGAFAWYAVNLIPSQTFVWFTPQGSLFRLTPTTTSNNIYTYNLSQQSIFQNLTSNVKAINVVFSRGKNTSAAYPFVFNSNHNVLSQTLDWTWAGPFVFPVVNNQFTINNQARTSSTMPELVVDLLGYAV